jgi:hypothetical protein
MMRRLRFSSGVLLLAGMALSLAEGVAAVTCGSDVRAPATHESSPTTDESDAMPSGHDCPPGEEREADEKPAPAGDFCPFTVPGAVQACTFVASLPASGVELAPASARPDPTLVGIEASPHFLRVPAIFRPPIA